MSQRGLTLRNCLTHLSAFPTLPRNCNRTGGHSAPMPQELGSRAPRFV